MSSQLNDSYSPQSKVDLASYRQLQQADELPLLDTVSVVHKELDSRVRSLYSIFKEIVVVYFNGLGA